MIDRADKPETKIYMFFRKFTPHTFRASLQNNLMLKLPDTLIISKI